ncbi:MAG: TRAP transporter large permease [Burkholderiales bacterium]|nr:TRAP transporter large permease [Burkholderiales bacterium]
MIVLALFVLALVMLALGFEMLLVMGVPALLTKWIFFRDMPEILSVQKMLGGVQVVTLLAIPFFIFAADIMSHGQIASRLTEMVRRLIGHYSGGLGHATVVSMMTFGAISGSAPATVAALGRLTHPELLRAGYREKFSLGLIASSAECALLIPPSITFIIYGWLTGTSIAALFAGGLVVGIVLGLAFMALVQLETRRTGAKAADAPRPGERWRAVRRGLLGAFVAGLVLVGIYAGFFTATEAAAVAVVLALLVELFVYRSLTFRDVARIAEGSAVTTVVVFVLLAMGTFLSTFLTLADVHTKVLTWIQAAGLSWITFLLIVNAILFVAGMFVDPNSILLLFVPVLFPVAQSLGIDPVHFGILVTLNICIGMITPPFGLDLFVASSTLRRPVELIIAGVWPFVLTNLVVLAIISYVPQISTALPRLIL